jgi:ribosomal protein S27AE
MAEKRVTAQKTGVAVHRHECPKCGADSRVTYFAGFGPKGFFWVCEKACGYVARTRQ